MDDRRSKMSDAFRAFMSEAPQHAQAWMAAAQAIEAAGELKGKILVDCTNPLAEGFKGLSIGFTTSAGEQVAGWAKGAQVVKAFNNTGWQNMANPLYGPERVTMFLCGDDREAKRAVSRLAEDVGLEACDSGPLSCGPVPGTPGHVVDYPRLRAGARPQYRLQDPATMIPATQMTDGPCEK